MPRGDRMSDEFWDLFLDDEDLEPVGKYDWDAILQKIKEYNEKERKPVTVGFVVKHFASEVKYRNEVRQWMERCVQRGLLVRFPPVQPGVTPKRVYYVHIDVYNAYKNKQKPKA